MSESPGPRTPRTPPPPVPPPGAPAGAPSPGADPADGPPRDDEGGHGQEAPPPARPAAGAVASAAGPGADDAPDLDDRDRTLDPRVVQVWRLITAIGLLIPFIPASVIAVVVLGTLGILVPVLGLVLLGVFAGWYPRARWERWRWRLTPLALELDYGVVVRTHEAVPYFRIQQIDVTQGPIDRLLGLATLQVTTASASGSASLPGIPAVDEAPMVRAELLARASRAVAQHEGDARDAV